MADRFESLHRRIDDLTDSDGEYAVVCPLSGKRPVPIRGKSFPSPDAAERAVDLVREYRTVLREVDPHLENVPLGVVEEAAEPLRLEFDRDASDEGATNDRRASGRTAGAASDDRESERGRNRDRGRSHWRKSGTHSRENGHRERGRQPSRSITLSGGDDGEWLRMDRAPVVTVREDGEPLDDAAVERQLNVEL